jgi:predicted DNA-binding transcriptional regulator AlpA
MASTVVEMEELVGLTEVATLVGISRQRVLQLIESDPDFPEPAAQMARGRVWKKLDIEKWAKATGRSVQG